MPCRFYSTINKILLVSLLNQINNSIVRTENLFFKNLQHQFFFIVCIRLSVNDLIKVGFSLFNFIILIDDLYKERNLKGLLIYEEEVDSETGSVFAGNQKYK